MRSVPSRNVYIVNEQRRSAAMSAARTSAESLLSLDEVFKGRRKRRPTGQPVHHSSYHEGEREERLWRQHNRFADRENNAWLKAAEEIDKETRQAGSRNGRLGHIARDVLRLLLRMRNWAKGSGRLDPSYDWLANELKRSRSAVVGAMKRLRQLGFVRWLRRTRLVDDPEPGGQYVKQISNAYVLELRGAAAELVGRILRRPTEKLRKVLEERRREAQAAADEKRPTGELLDDVADPQLRAALERVWAKLGSASSLGGLNAPLE